MVVVVARLVRLVQTVSEAKKYLWSQLTQIEKKFIKSMVDNGFGVSTIRLYRKTTEEIIIWSR